MHGVRRIAAVEDDLVPFEGPPPGQGKKSTDILGREPLEDSELHRWSVTAVRIVSDYAAAAAGRATAPGGPSTLMPFASAASERARSSSATGSPEKPVSGTAAARTKRS